MYLGNILKLHVTEFQILKNQGSDPLSVVQVPENYDEMNQFSSSIVILYFQNLLLLMGILYLVKLRR